MRIRDGTDELIDAGGIGKATKGGLGDLNGALYMPLDGRTSSENAVALVLTIAERIDHKAGKPFLRAVGATLCDLLRNARFDLERWSYREVGRNTFKGTLASHNTFIPIRDGLHAAGLIEHMGGYGQYDGSFGARASRFRATPALFALAADHGITPKRWRDHFAVPKAEKVVVASPLVLRGSKSRMGSHTLRAPEIAISSSDKTARSLRARMIAINGFMETQAIEPRGQVAFRRTFLLGGADDYAWNKGGRIAAVGASYQNDRKADRRKMTINGEPVVEIDIRASNLTILHGLKGAVMPEGDPYDIEGIEHREVSKAWINMTLGHTGFHRAWPSEKKKDLAPVGGGDLQAVYPISTVRRLILDALPLLSDWPSSSIGWADLQYAESSIIMRTMETLAFRHQVPCLPVHDSVIVPASQAALASEIMIKTFSEEVGIIPRIKVDHEGDIILPSEALG